MHPLVAIPVHGLIALCTIWGGLSLLHHPGWPFAVRSALAVAWMILAITATATKDPRWIVAAALAAVSLVILWATLSPSNDRDWTPEQARLPRATFDGDQLTIENVRHARYGEVDVSVDWETREYSLADVRTVDFMVVPFAKDWRGLAHTFVSFGFEDERYLAISVEIRREAGEDWKPIPALFRNFEIMYVVGDERDLLGVRTDRRNNPVHIYRTRATPEQSRRLLRDMLEHANGLADRPEFYNTLTNNCTTSIIRHVAPMMERDIPHGYRTVFPGHSDEIALEFGWIDHDGDLESARERYLATPVGDPELDEREWSRRVRGGR